MRQVFETCFEKHIDRLALFFHDFIIGEVRPFSSQPFLGSGVEKFLEIPSETGYITADKARKPVDRQIEHIMPLHEIGLVDLPRFIEITRNAVDIPVDRPQYAESFH